MRNDEFMILASDINDLSPHFLHILNSKMCQYPPKMCKMCIIPPKRGKNWGGWRICSLYSYINFGHLLVICTSPQNGGIVKESKVSHALDQVRFCISRFCRRSGDHGAIRGRGRFGSIRMVRCLGSGIQMFHLERVVQWCHSPHTGEMELQCSW